MSVDWESYGARYRQLRERADVPPLLASVMGGSGGTLLDLGCGEGVLLTTLREHFGSRWDLTGFEVSNVRGGQVRKAGHRVLIDGSGAVPVPDGSFDLVVSTHVIEHAPDDRAYAAELHRVVRPGGHVYVETPLKLAGAWYFRRSPTAGWVLDPTHVREYRSPATLRDILHAAGLQVVTEEITAVRYPLASAVSLLRRIARLPGRPEARRGPLALQVPIPRYRQQAVLARKPARGRAQG